jgi:protein TonB
LLAEVELPPVARLAPTYMPVADVVPFDVPMPRGSASVSTPSRNAAPIQAPSRIGPETAEAQATPGASDITAGSPGVREGIDGGFGAQATLSAPVMPDPPAPVVPRQPIPVGGRIKAPARVAHVAPVYPAIATSARVEGTVILEAVISETGAIERIRVLRSVPLLDAAAVDAVREWRYTPTLLNGVPVPVLMTITVTFRLRD